MALDTVATILGRVKVAPPDSPIAVFKCDKPGLLRAVFGATIDSRLEMDAKRGELIGAFCQNDDEAIVKRKLMDGIFFSNRGTKNEPTTTE
ncbi:hypothetical protein [Methylotuvimicrobium sp. KM1]|uniref:hypothetical protein n=1 Tax=unclassified Methylotuvimicrobium TaxID=2822412 RepID=UPI00384A5A20